jgi:hypothetical protein
MQTIQNSFDSGRYAKCIDASRRIRWEIERDVIRGRKFDFGKKFLPDGLSKIGRLDFLGAEEKRLVSQIQGRTYANMFGLVERFIGPKMSEVSRDHWLGDQTAFEALVRFTDEELKHQEMFRRSRRLPQRSCAPTVGSTSSRACRTVASRRSSPASSTQSRPTASARRLRRSSDKRLGPGAVARYWRNAGAPSSNANVTMHSQALAYPSERSQARRNGPPTRDTRTACYRRSAGAGVRAPAVS